MEPTKPNFTVKVHVRGPNAKPGIVQEISTQGMEIGNA